MAATKQAVRTDSKPDRSMPRSSGPKVFDVAHPGKTAPSATSRPVIVTNRTILQDPMVATSTDNLPTAKPVDKIVIRPLDDSNDKDVAPSAPEVTIDLSSVIDAESKKDKTKQESASDSESSVGDTSEKAKSSSEDAGDASTDEVSPESNDESGVATDDPASDTAKDKAADKAKENEAEPAAKDDTDDGLTGAPAADGTNPDSAEQKELAALEAKVKADEAIEELVTSKEYFLPINSVERHRSKVITVLGLVLIVVLALVLVDIMIDSGTIHIPGVKPVTHFFGV